MNPSTAELLAAVAATRRPRGDRAPERPQRRARGRARRRGGAEVPSRSSPTDYDPGGLAAAVAFDAGAHAGRERRGDGRSGRRGRDRRGHGRLPRRRARTASRSARAQWLGLADGAPVAGGETLRRGRPRRRRRACSHEPRGILTLLTGEEPAAARRPARRARGRAIPSSSSRCTTAASRTTRCSSAPSSLHRLS